METCFQALVKSNPTSGPHALITGVPTFEGPGESVADISDVLINVDQISKEWLKVKHRAGESSDKFLEIFVKFKDEHPVGYRQVSSYIYILFFLVYFTLLSQCYRLCNW